MTNSLSTRFNISRRGILIDSIICPNCDVGVETTGHLFFSCYMARDVSNLIARWWNVPIVDYVSYEEWLEWIDTVQLPKKNKQMLEGVFYISWWLLWWFRNNNILKLKLQRRRCFLMSYNVNLFYGVVLGVTNRLDGTIS